LDPGLKHRNIHLLNEDPKDRDNVAPPGMSSSPGRNAYFGLCRFNIKLLKSYRFIELILSSIKVIFQISPSTEYKSSFNPPKYFSHDFIALIMPGRQLIQKPPLKLLYLELTF
jgi:hypothetical protein